MSGTIDGRVEEILRSDPHIVEIIPEEKWDFREIDLSHFREETYAGVRILVEQLIQPFLRRSYIVDDFQNHGDRRRWEDEHRERHGAQAWAYLHANCLRLNSNIATTINALDALRTFYQRDERNGFDILVDKVLTYKPMATPRPTGNFLRAPYDEKTIAEKLAYVQALKRDIYAVLDYISVPAERLDRAANA